jgi:hypothetical protein
MKKGSAAAKAWGRKMKRLRNKPKRKTSSKKGGVRKTARRSYEKIKPKAKKVIKKAKSSNTSKSTTNGMKLGIKIPSIAKKAALGIGGAALATAIISVIMPNSSISKFAAPAGAFALGGIEGVIGSMAINMLSNGSAANTVVVPRLEVL